MFAQSYTELELIGRGNFGTAHLVRSKKDQKVYVAKKIILCTLKDKEQDDALRESSLLQKLNHPHIVSYKESFNEGGTLVIVMEYCEEGDLSFHIKRKKQREEYFPEKLILNWFLQNALALKYIHENKILHRDIKSSNIFVTSNGFVKIGDFGISRVLENTYDSANTVVGTPYYMSPEVCENKPYTYKSDVWALGCVLYELCTLKHAFDANNLLGLVYKIVKDQVSDIPPHYSKDLQNLVKKLLCKNDAARPQVRDIFQLEFIQKEMQEFIKSNGRPPGASQIPIRRTQTHQEIEKMLHNEQNPNPEGTMQTMKSGYMNTNNSMATVQSLNYSNNSSPDQLTPAQRLKLKKQQEADKQRDLLNNAARENIKNNQSSQQRRLDDLAGSNSATRKNLQQNQSNQKPQQITKPEQQKQNFDNTGKMSETLVSQYEQTSYMSQSKDFEKTVQSQMEQTLKSESIFVDPKQNIILNQQIQVTNSQLDRYTNAKMKAWEDYGTLGTLKKDNQNLGVTLQYGDEEFEEYNSDEENEQPRLTAQAGEKEVSDVVSLYQNQLSQTQYAKNQKQSPGQLDEIKEASQESWTSASQASDRDNIPLKKIQENRIGNLRKSAITKLGSEQFNKLYSFVSHHRSKGTSDEQLQKSLVEMVGKQKYSECLVIDEIIFLESMQGGNL